MTRQGPDDPYTKARGVMRTLGPAMLALGVMLLIIGVGQFIITIAQAMSGGSPKPPILFVVLGLPGMILLGIGMQLTGAGFIGSAAQYMAKENVPATQTTITAIKDAILDDDVPCPACSRPIEPDAKFCSHCGVQTAGLACAACQGEIEANDRFCDSCGAPVEAHDRARA